MSTFWNILKVVVPILLQIGGLLFGAAAKVSHDRIADPKAPTITDVQNTYGQGTLATGLILAGGFLQYKAHVSKSASPVTPSSTPIHISGDDAVTKSLLLANQQIDDELRVNIAALTAQAQKVKAANNETINVRKGA